jgi:Hypothetical glycosyl hydrolase family 15
MRRGFRRATSIALLAAVALLCALSGQAAADTPGTVHFVRSADTAFNSFVSSPSAESQAWLRAHMWRMITWSPYFDERNAWFPQSWMYQDAYAIYPESSLASQHPEWILRDAAGNKLFIPYSCSGGTCPQYAGDISNPAFRHYWIEHVGAHLAHGYRGLFVDDVNMEERVSDGAEAQVTPVGAGGAIAPAAWRSYMADFMAEVRAAFPSIEIAHNALWFANGSAGSGDPSIRREIESANYVNLERGANDSGLTGGNGSLSFTAMLAYVDQVHALGRSVVLDGAASDPQGMEYNLASYFLVSAGGDAVSARGQTPANWWSGFDVNLGEASDARHGWSNVLRRDFSGGMVLVNPPGAPTQTIALASPMRDVSGNAVGSLTLPPASGVVLLGTPPSGAQGAAQPAWTATQTTLETNVVRARSARVHRRHGRHANHRARAASSSSAHGRGALARVAGVVRNATQGSVVINVDRHARGRWLRAARVSVALSGAGRFTSLVHLPVASYRVCATYTGTASYRPSSSGYRALVVRAV